MGRGRWSRGHQLRLKRERLFYKKYVKLPGRKYRGA